MTSTHNIFPRASFVGFEDLFRDLEAMTTRQQKDHYPPHNIIKIGEDEYLIELALAGFNKEEIDIEIDGRSMIVSGEHDNGNERDYIHRGISTKRFKRTFRLSDHVFVTGADFNDGILSIKLKYELPEELKPRKIEIGYTIEEEPSLLTES